MIHVIATIDLKPGSREDFLKAFHALMPAVLAEDGCIAYGPAVDVDTGIGAQKMTGDNTVTVVEQWESVAALHAHLAAPHMDSYREQVKDLVQSVSLNVLQPA